MSKHPRKERPTAADVAVRTASKIDLVARDRILSMLSDVEVAKVSSAEAQPKMVEGEEYLDIERLDLGVRRANGLGSPTGRLLPKSAIHATTWSAILATLP